MADNWGNPTDFNLDQLRVEFLQTNWQDWTDIHEDFAKGWCNGKTCQQNCKVLWRLELFGAHYLRAA